MVLSLQSGSDGVAVVCDCFMRFVFYLLVFSSWCYSVPLVGLLLVDRVFSVRRLATEPGVWEVRPGCSVDK